jgi:hypothetical protein
LGFYSLTWAYKIYFSESEVFSNPKIKKSFEVGFVMNGKRKMEFYGNGLIFFSEII